MPKPTPKPKSKPAAGPSAEVKREYKRTLKQLAKLDLELKNLKEQVFCLFHDPHIGVPFGGVSAKRRKK